MALRAVLGKAKETYITEVQILKTRPHRLTYLAPYRSHAIPLYVSSNTILVNSLFTTSFASTARCFQYYPMPLY